LLSSEPGTPETVKARFWPWLEPFLKQNLKVTSLLGIGWTVIVMHKSLGGQVMLNYGSLDNTQLLLYYGFAIEANPYDSVSLELEPSDEV